MGTPVGVQLLGCQVADITYVRLGEAFIYLAVVLDAFSRLCVGWALDDHLEAKLAIEALDMAITARDPAPDTLIHHSDRGVQGGFNRSSQHAEKGGCDEGPQACFGSVYAQQTAFAWTSAWLAA